MGKGFVIQETGREETAREGAGKSGEGCVCVCVLKFHADLFERQREKETEKHKDGSANHRFTLPKGQKVGELLTGLPHC